MRSYQYFPVVTKRCSVFLSPNLTRTLRTFCNSNTLKYENNIVHQQVRRCFSAKSMNDDNKYEKQTVTYIMKHWHEIFEKEKVTEPKESIEHIIASVLGTSKVADLIKLKDEKLNEEQLEKLEILCECRLSRMPVQYLIGQWDFREITLKLVPPIFIPRPETEILVEFLLKRINDSKKKSCEILEIGCGSGAICLSLLNAKNNVKIVAIDVNPQACELTMENAKNLNLESGLILLNAKLKENAHVSVKKNYTSSKHLKLEELKFDFIVSNPPYIPTKRIFTLQPEVRVYEDIKALDGGEDGLSLIKPILTYASTTLNDDGFLILEVDSSHCEKIKEFVKQKYTDKLQFESVHKDFNGNDRYVEIKKIAR